MSCVPPSRDVRFRLRLLLRPTGVNPLEDGRPSPRGLARGRCIGAALRWLVPGLPIETPLGFVLAALGTSLGVGLLSGVLPARRAARLDPIAALRYE